MMKRGLRRYVEDLLGGRSPKSFDVDDFEAAQIRMAVDLRAARPGADEPRPEFVDALKERIAVQMSQESDGAEHSAGDAGGSRKGFSPTRRQVMVGTAAAATAAVTAVAVDRAVIGTAPQTETAEKQTTLEPNDGSWQPVARSDELAEGGVRAFDLGSVNGFVRRVDGRVEAVSGVCTHQGCRLWLDQPTDRLRCPCHATSFSTSGQVITHQLPIAPKPLPHYEVREHAGVVEVLAPTKRT